MNTRRMLWDVPIDGLELHDVRQRQGVTPRAYYFANQPRKIELVMLEKTYRRDPDSLLGQWLDVQIGKDQKAVEEGGPPNMTKITVHQLVPMHNGDLAEGLRLSDVLRRAPRANVLRDESRLHVVDLQNAFSCSAYDYGEALEAAAAQSRMSTMPVGVWNPTICAFVAFAYGGWYYRVHNGGNRQ